METMQESIRSEVAFRKEMGETGPLTRNDVVAKAVLDGDLGYFSDSTGHDYGLDGPTRDRLIAHSRQDAANAMGHAKIAYEAADASRRLARMAMWIGLLNAARLAWVLVKLA